MSVLIMFRSLTHAQRGARALDRSGISAYVAKAPLQATENGCSYCVRIPEKRIKSALLILENLHISYGRIFRIHSDDVLEEVVL